jgi:hypothetical protein
MTQVNRQLWELNNLNRSYWGQPLLPEPEGGFAEEPPPPSARLIPTIERWFTEATGGQGHRPRQPKIPRRPEVEKIAQLIYGWDKQAPPPNGPGHAIILEKCHRLQRLVNDTRRALREILDLGLPGATPGDPAMGRLVDICNAMQLAIPYVGPPSKQGPQIAPWHVMARVLAPLVSAALVSAGYKHPSLKPDGPVVRVICRALHLLEGRELARSAIASCLKRQQKRVAKI